MTKLKMLFLAANPADTSALRLDKESREAGERIRLAEHRDQVELVSRWADVAVEPSRRRRPWTNWSR